MRKNPRRILSLFLTGPVMNPRHLASVLMGLFPCLGHTLGKLPTTAIIVFIGVPRISLSPVTYPMAYVNWIFNSHQFEAPTFFSFLTCQSNNLFTVRYLN